ncbi:CxC2 domain-containing protein [Mycena kentingensis (nom. inval.)]|nr:CxC2 domain-containing protein [Mycena kentingensis (nom. inval.)]
MAPTAVDTPMIAYVQRVSTDYRRVYSAPIPVAPPSPVKRAREDAIQGREGRVEGRDLQERERYQMEDEGDEEEEEEADESNAAKPSDPAMQEWMLLHRDTFLRAMLWREGRRGAALTCGGCHSQREAVIRCRDCFGSTLWCEECCAAAHRTNPLHIVENGIHEIAIDFCGCYLSGDVDFVQTLRAGWFPSTTTSPRTCATFACLEHYQTISLHGKTTAYDYYSSLETLTDGVGIKPPDQYKVFLRLAQQYRHMMLLKRAGRGHNRYGVMGTGAGELALRCPACPCPEVNLPADWQSIAPEKRFLYTFTIALDACFRLKRRLVSSLAKDPPLGPGWAYMTDPVKYAKYLAGVTEQDDMSTCSGLAAVELANTKFSRGYAATGVAMGVCARHEFVQPTSVADLQRGERYANMDFVFFSLMAHISPLLWLIVSYDIVCQWTKKLKDRVAALQPFILIQIVWTGPGSRSDQLDDHWAFWNWRKLVALARLLRRRLDKARSELAKQEVALADFSKRQQAKIPEWMAMIAAWEEDQTRPNPYEPTVTGMSERAVRELFEQQEAAEEALGKQRIHDIGPTEFVVLLLAAEEEQRHVRAQSELKTAKTTSMKKTLCRARRKLNKSIARIRSIQATYMPAALRALDAFKLPQDTFAERVPLIPPSALSASQRANDGCREGLLEIERQLRDAQCRASLAGLRNQLHVKYRLLLNKKQHSRHQAAATRSRTLIARNESKILAHSDKYQSARAALVQIAGDEVAWPILRKEDIRYLDDSDEGTWQMEGEDEVFGPGAPASGRVGESRRVMSWIWQFTGTAGTDAELQESICIEWCKAFSRTQRWREEVELLEEEWRRLPLSFAHEEKKWEDQFDAVVNLGADKDEQEGMRAYAAKQADTYRDLSRRAEVVRTQPALHRGVMRAREHAWVYRRDASNVRVVVDGEELQSGSEVPVGADAGADFIEEERLDEFGNASDEEYEEEE